VVESLREEKGKVEERLRVMERLVKV